ncbi:SGNH/GDSL hydrolase family protein [Nocardioides terrisoli]|uniref:SGNH/GDSL hydrolase family protein n=1 Tax=Nocardioides terrisoli TaxID=3388267 RepID=UPI00287BAAFA|nr:SGNH/GDSL hydrolase family protein [Nocardioides marmorisolisilvae]
MRRAVPLWLLGLLLVLVSGCGVDQHQAPAPRPTYHRYVALGDTFTAAPYTGTTKRAHGCHRSTANYPTQLADALGARLTDVSCDGADTSSVRKRQHLGKHRVAPQLDAVHRDTQLVTISLGSNDDNLFTLIGKACGPAGAGCLMERYEPALLRLIDPIRQSLDDAIRAVQDKAPDARIVVVGYPRHVAAKQTCKAQPKMSKADRKAWLEVDQALDLAVSRSARDTGADFIDVYAASKGHGICAKEPWVRGERTHKKPGKHGGVAFGPTAAEQSAVAAMIRSELKTQSD